MTEMTITTNNVPRDLIDAWQLTADEQKQFDYLNWEAIERGEDSATFFRYRGELYDLNDFCRVIPPGSVRHHPTECDSPDFTGWHGYASDSFFSGMLIKLVNDCEQVIVGRYCC